MNFYLKGNKGIAAANALIGFPEICKEVYLMKDSYTSIEEYNKVIKKLKHKSFQVIELKTSANLDYSDTALLVGWNRMVNTENKNIFVIHDSILPKFRGWNPLVSALIAGEREIGATLFRADSGVDTGPIIRTERVPIPEFISIARAMELVNPMITTLTQHFLKNAEHLEFSYAEQVNLATSFSLWRDQQDYFIDFTQDSSFILRHILASGEPYSGARAWLLNQEVIITSARIVEDVFISNRVPGKVISIKNGNPIIVCGSGLLEITEARYLDANLGFFPFGKIKARFTRIREI